MTGLLIENNDKIFVASSGGFTQSRISVLCDTEAPVLRPLAPDRPSCPVGTDDRRLVAAGAAALIVLGVSAMFARRRARRRAGA